MLHHAKFCLARRVLGHEAVTTVAEALVAESTSEYLDLTDAAWRDVTEDRDSWLPTQIQLHIPSSECEHGRFGWGWDFERTWCDHIDTYDVEVEHVTCTNNSCIVITRAGEFLAMRSDTAPAMDNYRWQHITLGLLAGSSYDRATTLRGIAMAILHSQAEDTVLAYVLDVPDSWVAEVRRLVEFATDLRLEEEAIWRAEFAHIPNRYDDPFAYENFVNACNGRPYDQERTRSEAWHAMPSAFDHLSDAMPALELGPLTWATLDDVLDEEDYWHSVGDRLAAR